MESFGPSGRITRLEAVTEDLDRGRAAGGQQDLVEQSRRTADEAGEFHGALSRGRAQGKGEGVVVLQPAAFALEHDLIGRGLNPQGITCAIGAGKELAAPASQNRITGRAGHLNIGAQGEVLILGEWRVEVGALTEAQSVGAGFVERGGSRGVGILEVSGIVDDS